MVKQQDISLWKFFLNHFIVRLIEDHIFTCTLKLSEKTETTGPLPNLEKAAQEPAEKETNSSGGIDFTTNRITNPFYSVLISVEI